MRGTGNAAKVVFIDEFMFLDPRALPVILPTLANGAALILTSSIAPNAADDLVRMLSVKNSDGTPVVNVLNWILACPACTKKGAADKCTHVVRRPQHFQKASDHERQRALMSVFPGAFEREHLNVADEPTTAPAFDMEALEEIRTSADHVYTKSNYVSEFYVTLDPNGASRISDAILTSFFVTQHVMPDGSVKSVLVVRILLYRYTISIIRWWGWRQTATCRRRSQRGFPV